MENLPKKRNQRDYSLSFNLQVVNELEPGKITRVQAYGIQASSSIRSWLKKYGNFDYDYIQLTNQKRWIRHLNNVY